MSDAPEGPGWWQASDGKWYAPELHPDYRPPQLPPPGPSEPMLPPATFPQDTVPQPPIPPEPFAPPDQSTAGPIVPPKRRWWPWVAGGVGVLVAIGIVAAVAGGGDDDADTDDAIAAVESDPPAEPEATDSTPTAETEPADEGPVATDAPPESDSTARPPDSAPSSQPGTTAAPPPAAEPTCVYVGVDDFGDMQIELSFTNTLGDVPALDVTYGLIDADGVRVATEFEFVEFPNADERFRLHVDTLTDPPGGVDDAAITCEILEIEEGFGLEDRTAPADPSGCEFVEVDEFDDIQLEITATNPFDETLDLSVTYALRSEDGTRFSDSVTFVDVVEPGETVRIDEDTLTDVPEWLPGGVVTCDILSVGTL